MADIELQWPDPNVEMWPDPVPDLYAGEPVVVAAKLGTIHGELVATGVRADESWESSVPLSVSSSRAGINRLWARRKITSLMDEKALGTSEDELRPQIIEVAIAHHLVSKYTSLVAVDVTPSRPYGTGLKSGAVPTNLPAGWQYEKVFGTLPKGGTPGRMYLLTALLALVLGILIRYARGWL
jgi:Ca-activated chloride channel family protein